MSKTYQNIVSKISLIVMIGLMFSANPLNATHIVGTDMSFKCLGNDFYEITLIVRRDCINGADDAPFDDPAIVGIFDNNGSPLNFLGRFGQVVMVYDEITTVDVQRDDCIFLGGPVCVEEAVYKAQVFLPFREKGYVLAYQRCCRNITLNNIVSPLETGTTKFVCLTKETLTECNSSPEFGLWPDVVICANEPLSFEHSATDIDGDSLAYKLYVPHSGATESNPKPQPPPGPPYSEVVFSQGYGLDNLMGGDALQVDVNTGLITARPNTIGQFLVGVMVEEWRDGVLLSATRRDFEYNVRACTNKVLSIDIAADTVASCSGDPVALLASSTPGVTYEWTPLDGLTFEDSIFFSDPVAAPDQNTTYFVTAYDDEDTVSSQITVILSEYPEFTISRDTITQCEGAIESIVINTADANSVIWENAEGLIVTDPYSVTNPGFRANDNVTEYQFTVSNGFCEVIGVIVIDLIPTEVDEVEALIEATYTFDSLTNQFRFGINEDQVLSEFDVLSIRWTVDAGVQIFSGDGTDIDIILPNSEQATVSYYFTDSQGCEYVIIYVIDFFNDMVLSDLIDLAGGGTDTVASCSGDPVALLNSATEGVTYTWTPLEGLSFGDTIFYSDPMAAPSETTVYEVVATNGIITDSASITVVLSDYPEYTVSRDTITVCEGATETVMINTESTNTVTWIDAEGLMVTNPFSTTNPGFRGNDGVSQYVFFVSNGLCEVEGVINIDLIPTEVDEVESSIDTSYTFDTLSRQFTFSINEEELISQFDIVSIRWTVEVAGELFSGTGGDIDIVLPEGDEAVVTYYFTDSQGCEYSITYIIDINPNDDIDNEDDLIDLAGGGTDTVASCSGDPVALLNSATEGVTYTWTPLEGLSFGDTIFYSDPMATPSETTVYEVVATNGIITDSASITVVLSDYPEYTVSRDTITVCEGATETVMINTESTNTVTWIDAEGLMVTNPFSTTNPGFRGNDGVSQYVFFVSNGLCEVEGVINIDLIPTEVDEVESSIDTSYTFDTLSRQFTFSINEEELISQFDIVSIRWTVEVAGELFSGTGGDIDIVLPEGDEAVVTYYFTDSQGCEYSITYIIDINPNDDDLDMLSLEFIYQDSITVCLGETSRVIKNPNSEWTYIWMPEDNLQFESDEDKSNPLFVGTESTTYVVSVTDGIETITDTILMRVTTDEIELSFDNPTGTACGEFTNLRVNNPDHSENTNYEWSFSESFENVVASAQFVTIGVEEDSSRIFVRAMDRNFCESNVAFIDIFKIDLDYEFAFDTIDICVSDMTTVVFINNDTSDLSIEWGESDNILTDINSDTITVQSTPHTLEVRLPYTIFDGLGCEISDELIIPIDNVLDLDVMLDSDGSICRTAMFTVSSQEEDATYEWAFDDQFEEVVATGSTVEIDLISEGLNTIFVRGSHPEYCDSEIVSIQVENGMPDFNFDFDPLNTCISNSTEVNIISGDSNNPVSVIWESNDRITSDITALPITVTAMDGDSIILLPYTVTDTEGCSVSDVLMIELVNEIIATINIDSTSCSGDFGVLTGSVNGTTANFEWSLFNDFSSIISTEQTISLSLPEGQSVYLRASTDLCVSEIDSITLSEEGFTIGSDAPNKICDGDAVDITADNASRDFDIVWEPSDNIVAINGKTISIITLSGQDTIKIDYVATSTDGCIDEGTIEIPYGSIITPEPVVSINCGTYGLTFDPGSEFVDGDILWDFGTASDETDRSTTALPTFDFGAAGTYIVTVSPNTQTCQFESFTIDVVVPDILMLMTDNSLEISTCEGAQELNLGVSNNFGLPIVWTNQSGDTISTSDSIVINTSDFETLTASAIDENGCIDSLVFSTIDFDIDLSVIFPDNLGPDTTVCSGVPFPISVVDTTGSMLSYEWFPAGAIVSGQGTADVEVSIQGPTEITVIVTDEVSGCTKELVINPSVSELDLEVVADPGNEIFLGESVTIIANSNGDIVSYEWDNGDSNMSQIVSPTETTTYSVTITDVNGCASTGQITITVVQPLCDESDVFIPSGFSPNNDGNNDVLMIRSNFVADMDFQIVNRWGQEVFRSVNQRDGWNGRFGGTGKELEPDVYAYCVKVTCVDGKEFIKAGNVTLIR